MYEILIHSTYCSSVFWLFQEHFFLLGEERVNILWCQGKGQVVCEASPETGGVRGVRSVEVSRQVVEQCKASLSLRMTLAAVCLAKPSQHSVPNE